MKYEKYIHIKGYGIGGYKRFFKARFPKAKIKKVTELKDCWIVYYILKT